MKGQLEYAAIIEGVIILALAAMLIPAIIDSLNNPCKNDLAQCQSQKSVLEIENADLKSQLSKISSENDELKRRLDETLVENERLKSEVGNYNGSLKDCENDLEECKLKLADNEKIIGDIKFHNFVIEILIPTTVLLSVITIISRLWSIISDDDDAQRIISFVILVIAVIVLIASAYGWSIIDLIKLSVSL